MKIKIEIEVDTDRDAAELQELIELAQRIKNKYEECDCEEEEQ